MRTFEYKPATRERVPVLVALCGPSGSGKTFSALRLATGIQSVSPGDIAVIDTEARRALHYADRFKFQHIPFAAPFGPLDYLDAIDHCVKQGAKTIVVDSMSHEHEGPGGVLEQHGAEVERLSGGDAAKAERVKMLAWQRPKQARRRLINSIIGMPVNFILCFRAKEKLKIAPGKQPENIGYMPIAAEEFVFEMTSKLLLLPGSVGVPTLQSEFIGERAMIKVPEQFLSIFPVERPPQLTEEVGAQLARWASGGAAGAAAPQPNSQVEDLIAAYDGALTEAEFTAAEKDRSVIWKATSRPDQARLKAASDKARARLNEGAAA